MKKITCVLIFVMTVKIVLAFSPVGTYLLFQPNSQKSYLHFLRFDTIGEYVYYEFTISNERTISITLSDSTFGKWFVQENKIYLFSCDYLESESSDVENIYRIMPYESLIGDYLLLTVVDDCTLSHPDIYRQFKCVNEISPSSLDLYMLISIICDSEVNAVRDDTFAPNNLNNK